MMELTTSELTVYRLDVLSNSVLVFLEFSTKIIDRLMIRHICSSPMQYTELICETHNLSYIECIFAAALLITALVFATVRTTLAIIFFSLVLVIVHCELCVRNILHFIRSDVLSDISDCLFRQESSILRCRLLCYNVNVHII